MKVMASSSSSSTCFRWSARSARDSPASSSSSSATSPSLFYYFSSSSQDRRRISSRMGSSLAIFCSNGNSRRSPSPSFLLGTGTGGTTLFRSRSCDDFHGTRGFSQIRRAVSANSDFFFSYNDDEVDDEFVSNIQDLAGDQHNYIEEEGEEKGEAANIKKGSNNSTEEELITRRPPPFCSPIKCHSSFDVVPHSDWAQMIEKHRLHHNQNANLVMEMGGGGGEKERILKEEEEDFGRSDYCSAKRAFSSMVFMIRELQSHTLGLRELLFYEDLQGILFRIQSDMQASFCWLFQKIFSSTPTLMVSVMLLLANFTVHSMAHSLPVIVTTAPTTSSSSSSGASSIVSSIDSHILVKKKGKEKNDHTNNRSGIYQRTVIPKGHLLRSSGHGSGISTGKVFGDSSSSSFSSVLMSLEKEVSAWKRILEETRRLQAETRHEALMDRGILVQFVSPVTVEVESDEEYQEYSSLDLMYLTAVKEDPQNTLFLANYAQFLYQVRHDHDRAEYYFKRAAEVKPADAEALSRYANFLWLANSDLAAAEETYLEAIAADPGNTSHAANYAHFLWNTGGDDTCFPLDDDDDDTHDHQSYY